MRRNAQGLALLVLLLVTGAATLYVTYGRATPTVSVPTPASPAEPWYSYLLDVSGWYEITPNESAVASPIDLTIDGLKALPENVGRWEGQPYDLGGAVAEWFENPDLALSNLYHDKQGHPLWLSLFGSRGLKSYYLFEHTPITSYPAAGWTLVENGVTPIAIGERSIHVQKAVLTKGTERRIVLYWYLWSQFDRDPEAGVIAIRMHIPVTTSDQDAMDAGTDFLNELFPQVIRWRRF